MSGRISLLQETFPPNSRIRINQKLRDGNPEVHFFEVYIPTDISGSLHPLRKRFTDLRNAREYAKRYFNGTRNFGQLTTHPTTQQDREFREMLPRINERDLSVRYLLEYALERIPEANYQRSLSEGVEEFIEIKRKRVENADLTEDTFRDYRIHLQRLCEEFGDCRLHELTSHEIRDWIAARKIQRRTKKNYLNSISTFFYYASEAQWIRKNPLLELTREDRKLLIGNYEQTGDIQIFSVEQTRSLLAAALTRADLEMLGVITLGLFCGIRTKELQQLTWKNVKLSHEEPIVTVPKEIAKKRQLRNVPISPNAVEFLNLCPNRKGKIAPEIKETMFHERREKLRKEANLHEWPRNGMRHSFASYHFALYENSHQTSSRLGHRQGDIMLFDHYRSLTSKDQAKLYFSLNPNNINQQKAA